MWLVCYLFGYTRMTRNLIRATFELQHRVHMQQLSQQQNPVLIEHRNTNILIFRTDWFKLVLM